jgi:hypothetical protein
MPSGSKPGERRGGRKPGTPNRTNREIRALAAAYGPDAIAKLAKLMKSQNETIALQAAEKLLDRGYGRPAQAHRNSGMVGSYDLTKLSDEQLQYVYGTLRLAASGVGDTD